MTVLAPASVAAPKDAAAAIAAQIRQLQMLPAETPFSDREAAWRAAVYRNPGDRTVLEHWIALDPSHGSSDQLAALQEAAPTLIAPLIARLLPRPGFEELFARFAAPAQAWLASPAAASLDRLWQAHAAGRAIDAGDAGFARDADTPTYAAIQAARRRVIRVDKPDAKQRAALAAMGIDAAALTADLARFLTPGTAWSQTLARAEMAHDRNRQAVIGLERFCGYQEEAVRRGTLLFPDPFSGESCAPLDSCMLFGRSCYLYRGRHLFYLIGAGAGAKAIGLYVPAFNLILDFRAGLNKFIEAELWANTLNFLLRRLLRHVDAHNAAMALPAIPHDRRRIIVCIQQAQNFAHHVWNFYTGLERLVLADLHGQVESVIFAGSEFFGPLEAIYPEFEGRVQTVRRNAIVDPCPFDIGAMLLTVGGYFIPHTLRERLRGTLRRLPAPEGIASPESFAPLREQPYPIVWIGIRTGDKSWVDQEEGIRFLIDSFAEIFPRPLILIDGFSYPVGRDEISHQWTEAIDKLKALAERVRTGSRIPERVVNMVGNTLRESVLWAEHVDVYLSPVGTTQHKIGWFTQAPGLVYSAPRGHPIRPTDRLPGSWEAEGSPPPSYMIGEVVEQGVRRGERDRRAHLENMALDAGAILATMLGLLEDSRAAADARRAAG